MADKSTVQNLEVFSKVITALARDAALEVGGISLREGKRAKEAVRVSFLQNEKVQVDISVNIALGFSVPSTVATLQERVKTRIEASTKYKVNSVNVDVISVDAEQ